MSAAESPSKRAGLLARATVMLLHPAAAWAEIEAEPTTARDIWLAYILPLALIAPVCEAIGLSIFGASIAGIHLRPPLIETAIGAVVDYALALIATWALAQLVALLAPAFGGTGDRLRALKLVAYSGTAVWISGLFAVYPTLGFPVAILGGLYSLYALNLGLPRLTRTPHERSLTLFAVILVAAVILTVALRLAAGFVR